MWASVSDSEETSEVWDQRSLLTDGLNLSAALLLHPDKNKHPNSDAAFKIITEVRMHQLPTSSFLYQHVRIEEVCLQLSCLKHFPFLERIIFLGHCISVPDRLCFIKPIFLYWDIPDCFALLLCVIHATSSLIFAWLFIVALGLCMFVRSRKTWPIQFGKKEKLLLELQLESAIAGSRSYLKACRKGANPTNTQVLGNWRLSDIPWEGESNSRQPRAGVGN